MKPGENLLGLMLEREGILTRAQVLQATAAQQAARQAGRTLPFGLAVLELGLASEAQVRFGMRLQSKLAISRGQETPLSLKLIEAGVLTPSMVVSLLDEQARTQEPLDALLLSRQLVQPAVLDYLRAASLTPFAEAFEAPVASPRSNPAKDSP